MAEAAIAGVTRSQLKSRAYTRLTFNVFTCTGDAVSRLDVARAIMQNKPDLVVSRESAALTWDLPLPHALQESNGDEPGAEARTRIGGRARDSTADRASRAWADPVDLPTLRRSLDHRPLTLTSRSRRVRVRHAATTCRTTFVNDADITHVRIPGAARTPGAPPPTVPVLTREATWRSLAQSLTTVELIVIADHLVREPRPRFESRSSPHCTLPRLAGIVHDASQMKGVRRLREAHGFARVGSDSPQETKARLILTFAGLPEPSPNRRIRDASGFLLAVPDLSFLHERIAVQYQGASHTSLRRMSKDDRLARTLAEAGWLTLNAFADDLIAFPLPAPELRERQAALHPVRDRLRIIGLRLLGTDPHLFPLVGRVAEALRRRGWNRE